MVVSLGSSPSSTSSHTIYVRQDHTRTNGAPSAVRLDGWSTGGMGDAAHADGEGVFCGSCQSDDELGASGGDWDGGGEEVGEGAGLYTN